MGHRGVRRPRRRQRFFGGDERGRVSHVPPMLTKTWFHTGASLDGRRISKQFEKEYYREDDPSLGATGLSDEQQEAMLLDDTVLPTDISPDEIHEACRALKVPFFARRFTARQLGRGGPTLQRFGAQLHPQASASARRESTCRLFHSPRETIDFQYERKLYDISGRLMADPRVTHAMTLAVDEYGNVLQSLAISYGRRHADASLTADDQDKQRRSLIICTDNGYTNPVLGEDDFRAPLICETQTYELLNLTPSCSQPNVTNLFHVEEMLRQVQEAGDGDHDLPYEDVTGAGAVEEHPYRRLIERVRKLYRHNELTGPLPLGVIQSRTLPYESYKLAFTPGLIAQVYDNRVAESMFRNEGRLVHSEGDVNGWIPSGQLFFSTLENDNSAQELAQARQHFFLPRRYCDPFGASALVDYDQYDLSIVRTIDPLGNTFTATNDYRVLCPIR